MNQVRHTLQKFPGNMQNMHKAMRGAVAVEFALVLIPLLMLALGAAEFGRAIYQYNTLVKATRDSVRYLSHYNPPSTNYTQAKPKPNASRYTAIPNAPDRPSPQDWLPVW